LDCCRRRRHGARRADDVNWPSPWPGRGKPHHGRLPGQSDLGKVGLKLFAILLIVAIVNRVSRGHQRLWRLWLVPVTLTGAAVVNNILVIVME
jgi:hypothetical protein